MNGRIIALLAAWIGSWATAADGLAAGSRPNILLIVSDDQRPDTIRALGNDRIRTPVLDELVRTGTAFTRGVTAVPICVASRAELLTGRDGLRNGHGDFGFTPADDARCLAEALRGAGYTTCYTGKWHTSGRPGARGYAQTGGLFAGGGEAWPLTHPQDWRGRPVTGYVGWVFQTDAGELHPERGVGLTPDISTLLADEAIGFLTREVRRPFFLHVNFTAPHDPLLAPPGEEFRYDPATLLLPRNFRPRHPFDHGNRTGRDELLFDFPRTPEETRGELAVYYAVISHMDAQIGRVLAALDRCDAAKNTLVVFTSDHGLAIGSHGLRGKQNMYDHTIGVPLIVRGPGIAAGRTIDAQCYLRDLLPTICDLVGVPVPDKVDGRSLAPLLRGECDQVYDEVFTHFGPWQRAIRTRRWKHVAYPQAGREQLFDLKNDPDELQDVSDVADHAEVLGELRARLSAWRGAWSDPTLSGVVSPD